MCWKAPSTFSEVRLALEMDQAAAMFTPTPTSAVTSTSPPATAGGRARRRTASKPRTAESTSSVTPLACADRISARWRPKVSPPRAGRAARPIANSASRMDAASVSMWAASDNSARECATTPTTTSTLMNPAIRARPISSQRRAGGGAAARGGAGGGGGGGGGGRGGGGGFAAGGGSGGWGVRGVWGGGGGGGRRGGRRGCCSGYLRAGAPRRNGPCGARGGTPGGGG